MPASDGPPSDGRPGENAFVPGRSERAAVAAELKRLSAAPPLRPGVRDILGELSGALSINVVGATDGWSDIDLVGALARSSSFQPIPDEDPANTRLSRGANPDYRSTWPGRLLTVAELAPGVLVFIPLLITWLGLRQAAAAYHQMLADPATSADARSQNFLELWQTGFGGKLSGPFVFSSVALGTLSAVVVLILVAIGAGVLRRLEERHRDEDERDREKAERDRKQAADARRAARERDREELASRLVTALAQAQLLVNRDRMDGPARFGHELSASAEKLAKLMNQAAETHTRTLGLAQRYHETADNLAAAIGKLDEATKALARSATVVKDAADRMDDSSAALRHDVTSQVTSAADRLEAAIAGASAQLDQQQEAGATALTALHQRLAGSLERFADNVDRASGTLVSAGTLYAEKIQSSVQDATTHAQEAVQQAVFAAVQSLESGYRQLQVAIESVQAIAAEQAIAGRLQSDEQVAVIRRQSDEQVTAIRALLATAQDGNAKGELALQRHSTALDDHTAELSAHATLLRDLAVGVAANLQGFEDAAIARQENAMARQDDTMARYGAAINRQDQLLRRRADIARKQEDGTREAMSRMTEALDSASTVVENLHASARELTDRLAGALEIVGSLGRPRPPETTGELQVEAVNEEGRL
jgi:hypothetical protein